MLLLLVGVSCLISLRGACAGDPSSFSLLSPEEGDLVSTTVLLDWEDSVDPDGYPLTYSLYISKYMNSFDDPFLMIPNIRNSIRRMTEEDGIQDQETYYWKVHAKNEYGDHRESGVRMFKTDNPSSSVGACWVGGYIRNSENEPLVNARVSFNVWETSFTFTTDLSGYFLGQLLPGQVNPNEEETVAVEISAEGYASENETVTVTLDDIRMDEFTLDETVPISGDINGNRSVDIADAILAFQVIIGQTPLGIDKETALNEDKKIGLTEIVYIFRKLAGL